MKSVLIVADKKAPLQALKNLEDFGKVIYFESAGVVYDAIAGHPDIFMFQHPTGLVVAPQMPTDILSLIEETGVICVRGAKELGSQYPNTAAYNALYTTFGVLHNTKISDRQVLASHKSTIHCRQGYVRCNTIQVGNTIITSDIGIHKILVNMGISSLFADPEGILLPGFKNGFFGGCCGILDDTLFVCGSLKFYKSGNSVLRVLEENRMNLVELYQGPLVDIGGIFFLKY